MAFLSPEYLVSTLGEPDWNIPLFRRICETFPADELNKLLDSAWMTHKEGTALIADQSRRRTFGGIFLRELQNLDPARILVERFDIEPYSDFSAK